MEFSRFSLGLRFAMTPYAGLTPEQVLSLLFSRVFSGLVEGLNLYCMWDDTAKDEPEPAFVCVFSNASLRRAKKLFGALSEDTQLFSYLTAFQPFVQNNLVEKCGAVQFIGTVGKDGGYYFRKNDEPAFPLHADTLSSAADEAALLLSKLLA